MYRFIFLFALLAAISCKHDPFPYNAPPGGPVDPGDTTSPPVLDTCDPDVVYFQNDILPLILSSCGAPGCHDGTGVDSDGDPLIKLSNYAEISVLVDDDDWWETSLYEVLTETDSNKVMMPPGGPLPQVQLSMIAEWLQDGALDNACDDCDLDSISFTLSVEPILQVYCQGCHGATPSQGASESLTNSQEVQDAITNHFLLERIQRIGSANPMPPNQSLALDACQIQTILKWKELGYPL